MLIEVESENSNFQEIYNQVFGNVNSCDTVSEQYSDMSESEYLFCNEAFHEVMKKVFNPLK